LGAPRLSLVSLVGNPALPTIPYLSMPCRWATPEMTLQPFQGWPARSPPGGQPVAIVYPFAHPTPCAYAVLPRISTLRGKSRIFPQFASRDFVMATLQSILQRNLRRHSRKKKRDSLLPVAVATRQTFSLFSARKGFAINASG
jgi:hypothetical protein